MKTKPDPDSLLGHLVELRNRLLRCVVAVLLVFIALAEKESLERYLNVLVQN